jgi:hypothetical protein
MGILCHPTTPMSRYPLISNFHDFPNETITSGYWRAAFSNIFDLSVLYFDFGNVAFDNWSYELFFGFLADDFLDYDASACYESIPSTTLIAYTTVSSILVTHYYLHLHTLFAQPLAHFKSPILRYPTFLCIHIPKG